MIKTAIRDDEERKPVNHKGKPCPFKPITCQEGWCNECEIFMVWLKKEGITD